MCESNTDKLIERERKSKRARLGSGRKLRLAQRRGDELPRRHVVGDLVVVERPLLAAVDAQRVAQRVDTVDGAGGGHRHALAVAYDAMDELELARVAGFLGVRGVEDFRRLLGRRAVLREAPLC